jgi:hypothetical protein
MKSNKKTVKNPVKKDELKDATYTKRFTDSSEVIESKLKSGSIKEMGVVSKSSKTSAKPYEKKFVPATKKRTYASVVDSKGSVTKTADKRLGVKAANEKLYSEYKRDSTDTMNRRNKNLNYVNVHTGRKSNLDSKDLKSLLATDKIKKNK